MCLIKSTNLSNLSNIILNKGMTKELIRELVMKFITNKNTSESKRAQQHETAIKIFQFIHSLYLFK